MGQLSLKEKIVGVIGLGYVGLPLAVAFGERRQVVGFDVDTRRITDLKNGIDHTNEIAVGEIDKANHLSFTHKPADLANVDIFIITVPTPVDKEKQPDFSPLLSACEVVGSHMKLGSVVIFESTVYPGATEEICIPRLETCSGLEFNKDFFCGYSPERINPGDKVYGLKDICKIVSGSNDDTLEIVNKLYLEIIDAGTYKVDSIKIAEAAKLLENMQRDVNIALMNELAMFCSMRGIDTNSVINAAASKWNFVDYRPGLVGGHCIGVDPYYFIYKANEMKFNAQLASNARGINENMASFCFEKVKKLIHSRRKKMSDCRIAVLGVTFKENCADIRNSKVINLIKMFALEAECVLVSDPVCAPEALKQDHGLDLMSISSITNIDVLVLAVAHSQFIEMSMNTFAGFFSGKDQRLVFDIKNAFPASKWEDYDFMVSYL